MLPHSLLTRKGREGANKVVTLIGCLDLLYSVAYGAKVWTNRPFVLSSIIVLDAPFNKGYEPVAHEKLSTLR